MSISVKTNNNQPTMSTLLSKVTDLRILSVGQTVKGKLIFVTKNKVLIDLENTGIGIVRGKELYNEEYLSRLKVGEEVEAIVINLDNELGMIELSFREIGKERMWQEIKQAQEQQLTVEATIRDANRGGFLVKVRGIDGFLPASLLSPTHAIKQVGMEEKSLLNQIRKYIGQVFQVKIVSINPETETVIVSEKAVSDEIVKEKLTNYKNGDIVEGEIIGIVDFGLFVRFDENLDGLVHISEIAWKKVEDPRREFKVGEKIKAKIIDIDQDNRINLSIKQITENPWTDFVKNTKPGDTFVGKISKIVSYGVIVINQNDIQGLCHISQISDPAITNPADIHKYFKIGDTSEFTILSVQEEKLYLTKLPYDLGIQRQNEIAAAKKEETDSKNLDNQKKSDSQKEDNLQTDNLEMEEQNIHAPETLSNTEKKQKKTKTKKTE